MPPRVILTLRERLVLLTPSVRPKAIRRSDADVLHFVVCIDEFVANRKQHAERGIGGLGRGDDLLERGITGGGPDLGLLRILLELIDLLDLLHESRLEIALPGTRGRTGPGGADLATLDALKATKALRAELIEWAEWIAHGVHRPSDGQASTRIAESIIDRVVSIA